MDVRSLKYFVAVYEEQSLSGAAKRCFVAQPSISTTLAQLEERLAVKLFLRHRRGVTPTEEARTFYRVAIKLIGEFSALGDLFKQEAEDIPLTLAIMPTIDATRIGEFLTNLTVDTQKLLLRLVNLGEHADARIVSEQLREKHEHFIHLWDENYVLAIPLKHRLTLQNNVALENLQGERFIERCLCEVHDEVSGFLDKQHIKPVIVAKATNEEWAVALVEAGLGMAIVPESSVRDGRRVCVRPIKELNLMRRVGFAYDPKVALSTGLRIALEQLAPKQSGNQRYA